MAKRDSPAKYRLMVNYAAHRLRDLGGSLHPDATVMPEMVAPWSLLQRTTNLVEAIFWLLDGPSDAAVRIVTRSLVDLAISVAWLRLDPDVHVRLWTAEAWRRELDLLPAFEWRTGTRLRKNEESLRALETKRAVVMEARQLALERRIVGVGRAGPLVPSLKARAEAVGTDAAREAYSIMFTHWSEWGHTGAGSLSVSSDGASVTFDEGPPRNALQARSIACGVYAYVLAELSRWIGLNIEDECDTLRDGLIHSELLTV